jgi:hypothetical protein
MAGDALRKLAEPERPKCLACLKQLIAADRQVELFELMVYRLALRRLELAERPAKRVVSGGEASILLANTAHCEVLLSTLAWAGTQEPDAAALALAAAVARLKTPGLNLKLIPAADCHLKAVDQALNVLGAALSVTGRRVLLQACQACVAADRAVTVREAQVLRLLAEALDMPMTPILARPADQGCY